MTSIVQHALTGTLVEVSDREDLKLLPKRAKQGGHIYLIEFSDSTVKAGKSISPQSRMTQHYGESIRYGQRPIRIWVSPEHKNYSGNESAAMRICAEHGELSGGREYFSGTDLFDTARLQLENLDFAQGGDSNTLSTREWIQDMIEAEHARYDLEKLKESLGDIPEVLLQTLGMIFQDSPDKFHDWLLDQKPLATYEARLTYLDTILKLSESFGMSASQFLELDRFELHEMLIIRLVSQQIEILRHQARTEGMHRLFEPIREDIDDAAESVGL